MEKIEKRLTDLSGALAHNYPEIKLYTHPSRRLDAGCARSPQLRTFVRLRDSLRCCLDAA
jgi:hypothetical protein